MHRLWGLHKQTDFLITLLMKSKHTLVKYTHTQNLIHHTRTINSWLTEVCLRGKEEETGYVEMPRQEPQTLRRHTHSGPRGMHSFTFPSMRRSAWRNRSLWNMKRSYTADTASTVTPCSFHSMLAAAHHKLPTIQAQHLVTEPPSHRLLWKPPCGSSRSLQCLA